MNEPALPTTPPASAPPQDLLDLFRCPADCGDGRSCLGRLAVDGDRLSCTECGGTYPLTGGVPVLRERSADDADVWFEAMYEGRDRGVDVQTEYLAAERRAVAELVARHGIGGPSLEVGCGTGMFAGTAPGYVGLEYSLRALLNPGLAGVPRACGDAARLPFAEASFELVFSFNTLEHVEQVGRAFAEMDRVLAPGGMLVLAPAWHCPRYQTELIPILPYSQLTVRQKVTKSLLPLLQWRGYKLATRLPGRVWRRLSAGAADPLRWRPLTPARHEYVIPDQDAVADLDSHEGIWFYVRRGYECPSHPGVWRQLLAGHDVVVLRKPACR